MRRGLDDFVDGGGGDRIGENRSLLKGVRYAFEKRVPCVADRLSVSGVLRDGVRRAKKVDAVEPLVGRGEQKRIHRPYSLRQTGEICREMPGLTHDADFLNHKRRKGKVVFLYNLIIAFVMAGSSIYIVWTSSQMKALERVDFGPGAWPYCLGIILFLLSIGFFIETLVRRHFERRNDLLGEKRKPAAVSHRFNSPGLVCVYKLCGLLVVFAFLLRYTNFLFAVFVFIPAGMWILGSRKATTLVAMAVGVPLSIYLIFAYMLKITLP
jgi:hypothetical protein